MKRSATVFASILLSMFILSSTASADPDCYPLLGSVVCSVEVDNDVDVDAPIESVLGLSQ